MAVPSSAVLADETSARTADGYATVTVIIRSTGDRRRAATLRRAVRSVLSQGGVHVECIVVFNGSDYDNDTIAWTQSQARTRCVVLDAPAKAAATFIGRALVTSEFFGYLDDDDELLPASLQRRVKIMRARPDLDCVATNGFYVQGNTTRLLFEQARLLKENGYVQSILGSRNWLASCGGLFRSATVKMSYFDRLPAHREWTVLAFRVASALNVHFEDIPTFRVNSSLDSQSKQDSYIDAGIVTLELMKRCTNDARQLHVIRQRQGEAYRSICSYYRLHRNFRAAWRAYWNAIRSEGGWHYIPYIIVLLLRRTEPWSDLIAPYAAILHRLTRNPKKYLRASWWVPLLRLGRLRACAACLYTAPALLRSLHRQPGTVLVFPSRMNRYQPAETYVAWKVFAACDLRISGPSLTDADIAIAWNPSTTHTEDESLIASAQTNMTVLNARCTDIRKSTVDQRLREIFGYGLEIDPLTYSGSILRKSEMNGAHDATVLQGPLAAVEPGYVYQRLVSYETPRGMVEWRVFIVGKKPVAVYRLYAPPDDRFAYWRERAEITTIEAAFSSEERVKMTEFCDRMGLDFGVLDVLRDAADGRIYVCDCNNTPTGPSPTLSMLDQLRIVNLLAAAFRREYLAPAQEFQSGAKSLPVREVAR